MTPQGFVEQPRRRDPRRHLDRPGHRRVDRGQADVIDPPRPPLDRQGRASRSSSTRTAATIRASASARRRSPRRCSRIVLMDHALRHRAQNADVDDVDAADRGAGAGRRDREAAGVAARSTIRIPTRRETATAHVAPFGSDVCRYSSTRFHDRCARAARERELDRVVGRKLRAVDDDLALRRRRRSRSRARARPAG